MKLKLFSTREVLQLITVNRGRLEEEEVRLGSFFALCSENSEGEVRLKSFCALCIEKTEKGA